MQPSRIYDCAIVGGGLAGLCLAIELAQRQFQVVLFEKNRYPFHKVCGEYHSMESWDYLERLGIPLSTMQLPQIRRVGISSVRGYMLQSPLTLGGFGVSRFTLDEALAQQARRLGVLVMDGCKVNDANTEEGIHTLKTAKGDFRARLLCGSYGKITPSFIDRERRPKRNHIGVKYHISIDFPADRIELHNFHEGYCGISKVDQDRYCLCYVSSTRNLQAHGNDIQAMEQAVLMRNPHLKAIFEQAKFLYDKPQVISNVTFSAKQSHRNGAFLLGDAAGTIAPLCGNGMSMAMRAAHLLAKEVDRHLHGSGDQSSLQHDYDRAWKSAFGRRIKAGYYLQYAFGHNTLTHLALRGLHHSPRLTKRLIRLTHGMPF